MRFKYFYALMAILAISAMTGCRSKMDLDNIDAKAEVEMGIALPVGSMHATIGDFFGTRIGDFYVDTIEEKDGGHKGVITWKKPFDIERNFHADSLDLTNMVSSKQLSLDVYEKLPEYYAPGTTDKVVIGDGSQIALRFDMPVNLKGINKELGGDRLDSALIEMARFTSQINLHNGLPLEWSWIDEVTLEMGPQINRPNGNIMTVYQKGEAGGYGQHINTDIDAFTICLMKNRNLDPKTQWSLYDLNNVVDSCEFFITFKFTIPNGTTITVPKDAGFDYNLNVEFIRYSAIWGKFVPSSDMHDEDTILISEYIKDLDFISKWNLPFNDPKIDMQVITHIAGALVLNGDYLYAEDANQNKSYAEFYANRQHNFKPTIVEGQYLPLTSAIGDSTENIHIPFSKADAEGRIDRLFQNMPQLLAYKFNVNFNYQETPQIRITPNTAIRIHATCTLPLIFNEGLHMEYKDTVDLDISQYSIDSLIANVEVIDTLKTTNVQILLHAKNEIPLDIKATMLCLDENGNIVMDPKDPTKPFTIFQQDTIMLKAPQYEKISGTWQATKPGETTIAAHLTKAEANLFPKIKKLVYSAYIDDDSLEEAYQKGLSNIRITNDQGLTLKIGLSGEVDAILNFGKDDNK